MKLPERVARAGYSIEFKGLNHNMYVGENQFYDIYNLCSTNYPRDDAQGDTGGGDVFPAVQPAGLHHLR